MAMKLKFKVQPYQTLAVDAVVDCFAGQPFASGPTYRIDPGKRDQAEAFDDEGFRNTDFALTEAQRNYVIERYAALDVYARFCLDLQKTVLDKAPDAVTGMRRLRYIREFISEQVSASFRKIRDESAAPTTRSIAQLTRSALTETLAVFEEYTS